MNEVNVYYSLGNLKREALVNPLNIQEKMKMVTASIFRRNKRTLKPPVKLPNSLQITRTANN